MINHPKENREKVLLLKNIAGKLLEEEGNEKAANKFFKASRNISDRTIVGNFPPSNILQDLCNLLNDCKIKFAAIGGLAVCVRGQFRSTEDIDMLVSKLPGNDKLRDVDYMGKFNFYRSKSSTGTVLILEHKSSAGYAELLLANDNISKWALNTSTCENILKVILPVVSSEALVVTKIKASVKNIKRRSKDFPDVLSVLLKNKVNLNEIIKFLNREEKEILEGLTKFS